MNQVVENCTFLSGFLSPAILALWKRWARFLETQLSCPDGRLHVNGQKSSGTKLAFNGSGPLSLLGNGCDSFSGVSLRARVRGFRASGCPFVCAFQS